jgi:UDP-N-acetylmuramate dehydrogenase
MAERPAGIRELVPLAPLTTLDLGGVANHYLELDSANELEDALEWARCADLPVAILGGGSNLVIADRGWEGVAIRIAIRGVELRRASERVVVQAAAGEPWDELLELTVAENLAGLECLSGIPGSVGATPIQNVGAYGQEVSEVIEELDVYDRVSGERLRLPPSACGFGYRSSRFRADPQRFIVLAVSFGLRLAGPPCLSYPEVEQALAAAGASPSLAETRRVVLELRRSKSMVIDPSDPNHRSVGSFFVNPVVSSGLAGQIAGRAGGAEIPSFKHEGGVKLSAAWLIERCGYGRGLRRGGVGLSSRHALALVHHGGGSTAELIELAREIRASVRDRFGIDLRPEPSFLGFSEEDPTAE